MPNICYHCLRTLEMKILDQPNKFLFAVLSFPVMTSYIGGLGGTADLVGVANGTLEDEYKGVAIIEVLVDGYEGVVVVEALVGDSKMCAIALSTSKRSPTGGTATGCTTS